MLSIISIFLGIVVVTFVARALFYTLLGFSQIVIGLLLMLFATICDVIAWTIRKGSFQQHFTTICHRMVLMTVICHICLPSVAADESATNPTPPPPLERSITDTLGRSLQGTIIGRSADNIRFRRADGKELTIEINTLSERDRTFVTNLPEGVFGQTTAPNPKPAEPAIAGEKFEDIDDGNEVFLGLPFKKQGRGGICTAAAMLNCLQYMDPSIKMSQEELFTLFHDGRRSAHYLHIETAAASLGYQAVHTPMRKDTKEDLTEDIHRSLRAKLPVLSANRNHMMVTVGYNEKNGTLTLWDQAEGGDKKIGNKPEGTEEIKESAYLKKIISIITFVPPDEKQKRNYMEVKPSEKLLASNVGENIWLYKLTPPKDAPDLEKYLEHSTQARLAVELRRDRRVFISDGLGQFIEILTEPTDKVWKTKSFPAGKEEEMKEKQVLALLLGANGEFYAVVPKLPAPLELLGE